MWAIGEGTRKVSPASTRQCSPICRISAWIELWLCSTPLGLPVVPDVYRIIRTASGSSVRQRASDAAPEQVAVCRVRAGRRAHHHDLGRRVQCVGDAAQHRGVVVAAEFAGHEDHPAVDVVEDEAQFVVAQRRQNGVDHHPGQRRPEVDDGGLVPVRQHERHHAANRHPLAHRRGQGRLPGACNSRQSSWTSPSITTHALRVCRARRRAARRPACSAPSGPAAYASAARSSFHRIDRPPTDFRSLLPQIMVATSAYAFTRRMVIEYRNRDDGWVLMVTWAISPSEVV